MTPLPPATRLHICDVADAASMQLLAQGLNDYNDASVGYGDRQPLAVLVKDAASGQLLGGACGRTSLGLAFLELFYLPPALRGQGLGSRVLAAFEGAARQRGCNAAVLYTLSFQAPGFYQRHGWQPFGEIPCQPAGSTRIFLSKTL